MLDGSRSICALLRINAGTRQAFESAKTYLSHQTTVENCQGNTAQRELLWHVEQMSIGQKPRPPWFSYAIAAAVGVLVALVITTLGTWVGH
jgi:hypothetical protein